MILHISIPARDPRRVASVLAELMQGQLYPFPGALKDAFMAVSGDVHGTQIEVYKDTVLLTRADNPSRVAYLNEEEPPANYPFHFALTVPIDEPAITRIAQREGWALAGRTGQSRSSTVLCHGVMARKPSAG